MSDLEQYQPLFLKYRPQTLADLIGQESLKQTLTNAIQKSKLVHAYLFTGPRGAGKTSSARILAKCLNCDNAEILPTAEPCGKCPSCLAIADATSLDVTEIDAASHGNVEDARSLIERVNLATISGKTKVYIIDEVHMLSNAAFNALLKVFEEPPEKVMFILATTEEDKVLPTIRSRCQVLRFKSISVNDCKERLKHVVDAEQFSVEDEVLEFIAKRSDGAMRDALALLDQLSVFSNAGETIDLKMVVDLLGQLSCEDLNELLGFLLARNDKELLEKIDQLYSSGKEPLAICKDLEQHALELLENFDDLEGKGFGQLPEQIAAVEKTELVQIIDSLAELEYKTKQSSQAKNLLRAHLLKLAFRQDILVVKDLLARLEALEQGGASRSGIASPAARNDINRHREERSDAAIPSSGIASPAARNDINRHREERSDVAIPSSGIASPTACNDSAPARNDSDAANQKPGFLNDLSPACKGLFISSKAKLIKVENSTAVLQIPERFKFLQQKLEKKSEEILAAISAHHGSVSVLQITLGDNAPTEISPPHLDADYQKIQPLESPEAGSQKKDHKADDLASYQEENSATAAVPNEDYSSPVSDSKIDQAVSMAESVFGAKKL